MSVTLTFLPETGRGTAEGGGGGWRPYAASLQEANPLRQPLRVRHLPTCGEETQ